MLQNAQTILNLLEEGFPRLKVLVVGDLMLDRYIFGDVNRISPEAPVPILKHAQRLERAGGAANVTMNLAGLGVQSYLAGFWGKDAESALLEGLLKTAKIDTTAVLATDRATTSKTRIVGRNQQLIRLDIDPTENPTAAEMQKLTGDVLKLVPQMHAVVLSDYDKGTLTRELCEAVIRAARSAGIPVLADPKTPDLSKYSGATTVCPNLGELALATGVSTKDMDALLKAGQRQVVEHGFEFMTVTMSEKGIQLLRPESMFHSAAVAREVSDVSGAGDTVIATLAAGLACRLDVEETVQLANIAAAIVVGKRGTVPIHAEELVAQLTRSTTTHAAEKLLDMERLKRRVAEWRAVGETVVFTNGCFDILHVGHITLLEECRRFGSKLVVGMNTDASVCTLKGPARPIVGERERARIMAALAATDAVILFNEETPIELIRALKPDVIVKGGDYTVESVVGHEDVAGWGGRVEIVPTVEGFSTTNIVKKLQG
jgi:D-beta-D-heptose 7-phosphate kinase / D-beta-D-heptose 1-phosphate adenosyltransferase